MTIYVGTYTKPSLLGGGDAGFPGHAEGIYRLEFDEKTGALAPGQTYSGIINPSYLALSGDGRRLYCVHELERYQGEDSGAVSAYAIEDETLRLLGMRSTEGRSPCHVAISPEGTLVTVANYNGGSMSVFSLKEDGALGRMTQIVHEGSGPDRGRQEAPHVHSTRFTPSGAQVLAMDLGTDAVTAYPVRDGVPVREGARVAHGPAGGGPRMSAYDARRQRLYVLCEMGDAVAVFACDAQGVPMERVQVISTLPEGAGTFAAAADIHLSQDGRFLYASTRGHDSLSVFAVEDGDLTLVQNIPCGGETPRGFTLSPSGRWLLCGNQDSDTITVFSIDTEKGTLAQQSALAVPSPVCLVFVP